MEIEAAALIRAFTVYTYSLLLNKRIYTTIHSEHISAEKINKKYNFQAINQIFTEIFTFFAFYCLYCQNKPNLLCKI